ncbi:hypothetical protein ACS0TY_017857 [Phlomoides rotata]
MKDDVDECNMDVFDNGIQIILKEIGQDLSGFKCGLVHFFLQHTSASLTVNENYDSDVRDDTETFLNKVVPEGRSAPWKHTMEEVQEIKLNLKNSRHLIGSLSSTADEILHLSSMWKYRGFFLISKHFYANRKAMILQSYGEMHQLQQTSMILPQRVPLQFQGLSNRRTSATRVNAESSRSHRVFTCVVESRSKS